MFEKISYIIFISTFTYSIYAYSFNIGLFDNFEIQIIGNHYIETSFIENDSLTPYSLVKLKAERTIMHLKSLKTKITILRIPMINTRQNLSLLNRNLPNFRTLLFSNKEITKKVFFKD